MQQPAAATWGFQLFTDVLVPVEFRVEHSPTNGRLEGNTGSVEVTALDHHPSAVSSLLTHRYTSRSRVTGLSLAVFPLLGC